MDSMSSLLQEKKKYICTLDYCLNTDLKKSKATLYSIRQDKACHTMITFISTYESYTVHSANLKRRRN